jgi:hypothetical protein
VLALAALWLDAVLSRDVVVSKVLSHHQLSSVTVSEDDFFETVLL